MFRTWAAFVNRGHHLALVGVIDHQHLPPFRLTRVLFRFAHWSGRRWMLRRQYLDFCNHCPIRSIFLDWNCTLPGISPRRSGLRKFAPIGLIADAARDLASRLSACPPSISTSGFSRLPIGLCGVGGVGVRNTFVPLFSFSLMPTGLFDSFSVASRELSPQFTAYTNLNIGYPSLDLYCSLRSRHPRIV